VAEVETEVEDMAGEPGEEMIEVDSTPTWSLSRGIVVSVEAGRGRDRREEVVKEKDISSLAVVKVEENTGNTRGTRDQVGTGAATCDKTLEKKEDMMTGQGAEVKTGKVKEIEITGGDMMTGQGRRNDVLQGVETASKMQGKVKAEHKGEMNDSRLGPLRAATREHLKEVVEVKEVEQGVQEAGLHRVNPTRSGRKPKGSPAIRFPNTHQVRITLLS